MYTHTNNTAMGVFAAADWKMLFICLLYLAMDQNVSTYCNLRDVVECEIASLLKLRTRRMLLD